MSNPTNLQELADSLAASAHYDSQAVGAYQAGYRTALLDTRATVLAMIAEQAQRIAQARELLAEYDGPDPWDNGADEGEWCEAFVTTVRPLVEADYTRLGATEEQAERWADAEVAARRNFHKAKPERFPKNPLGPSVCETCRKAIKHLPAGQGWVHEATGMVVGDGPQVSVLKDGVLTPIDDVTTDTSS